MARKQKMKVYHGVPKSITDNHTIFYADFDGHVSDVTYENEQKRGYKCTPTGYGTNRIIKCLCGTFDVVKPITFDFVLQNLTSGCGSSWGGILKIAERDKVTNSSSNKIPLHLLNYDINSPHAMYFMDTVIIPSGGLVKYGDDPIFIRVAFDGINVVRAYVNGNLVSKNTLPQDTISKYAQIGYVQHEVAINCGHNDQEKINNVIISDLHISNIDRGDYFPNLPQDLIEGKAVIKPRMGQQQIKGDPIYNQITELKVEAFTGTEYPTLIDSNYYQHKDSPELSAKGANHWNAQSSFRIKGLNDEIISGVIDTDTALAKITESNLNKWNITTLTVNDVSKFSVGDTIVLYVADTGDYTSEATIQSVDTENKVITLASKLLSSQGGTWGVVDLSLYPNQYVFETTPSSSSPTVKTKNGTTVVGTWSGLGTKIATFTLGENTEISGKDLYVTYSLNTPLGNSDFPELPHTIERAYNEEGVEMKPVSEVIIQDDFKGKISGSNKECPHSVKSIASTTLQLPSGFTYEHSTTGYKSIINFSDSDTLVKSTNTNAEIPQQLFSFNVQEIVERKLGCEIPARDKVQWLKENISLITINLQGYATNPSGSTSRFRAFLFNSNTWSSGNVVTSSSVAKSMITISSAITEVISPEGMLHCLYHSDVASNGTITSSVYTDYVEIIIQLKVDSTFTPLYCENIRAREDVCNPVLIQKETKTVKRYLPSKECFVTEYSFVSPKYKQGLIRLGKPLLDSNFIYLTTNGTGNYLSLADVYRECVHKLGVAELKSISTSLQNDGLADLQLLKSTNMVRFLKTNCYSHYSDDRGLIPVDIPNVPCVALKPFLVSNDGELQVTLSARYLQNKLNVKHYEIEYTLPNRPLIK